MRRLVGTVAFALSLSLAAPALAHSYDCADTVNAAPEGAWSLSPEQEEHFTADRAQLPDGDDFMFRYCGCTEDGKKLVMVGALHIVDDWALCDDDANYAIYYDPETRKFAEPIPHQKLCGHGMKLKRPGT